MIEDWQAWLRINVIAGKNLILPQKKKSKINNYKLSFSNFVTDEVAMLDSLAHYL